MVEDIDDDQSKICFCEACIEAKITRTSSRKPISAVTEKLIIVQIDLWRPSPHISFQRNRYMWIATNKATGRVLTEFCPNNKELLQSIRDWKKKA